MEHEKHCSDRRLHRTMAIPVAAAGLALLWAGAAQAAATCSISTTPTPPTITTGQSVAFTGTVTGKTPVTYTWTFAGGTPASSTAKTVTVSYANAGNFLATLNGKNGRNETCTASVTVQVNAVGNQAAGGPERRVQHPRRTPSWWWPPRVSSATTMTPTAIRSPRSWGPTSPMAP